MRGRQKTAKHKILTVVLRTECTKSTYGSCSEDDFFRISFSMYPATESPPSACTVFHPVCVISVLGLTWHCQPHFALHSSGDHYTFMLVHWPSALCLDGWILALQTSATTLLLWELRRLSGAPHYPLFSPSSLSPSSLHLTKSVLGSGWPNIFSLLSSPCWDWTRRLSVNASHNMAHMDLLIDLEMPGKLRLWSFRLCKFKVSSLD